MTDDDLSSDELEYLKRERPRFSFFKKVEEQQSAEDSEKPADAPSAEPIKDTGQP